MVAPKKSSLTRSAFALVVVSFLLSTVVSLMSLHAMSRHNVREMNKVLATQIYDYMSSELTGPIMAARTMSSNSFLGDMLVREGEMDKGEFVTAMREYLVGTENGLGYQASFVISDVSKNYYTREGLNRIIDPAGSAEDKWYAEFAESGARYDLDVDNDEKNKSDLMVYVNARIDDGTHGLLGVCGVGVRMTGIQELFKTFEESFGVKINLVDENGIVQVDTNSDNIEAVDLGNMISGKKSRDYMYEELGGERFAVTKYVEDLGWYLVVQSDGSNEAGQFASIIGLNVALCVFVLVAIVIALRVNQRRTNELANASLVDQVTQVYNKHSFELDKARMGEGTAPSDLVCMTVDVNGLKRVNDTLGHDAGDELILGAAECLRACLAGHGKVYRTGGDEFCALLRVTPEELERIQADLPAAVQRWSGTMVESLSVSCGYAAAWEFPEGDVALLVKISDERMYEDKTAFYERTGAVRRT